MDDEQTEPCKIWIEQCEAARTIEDEFGTDRALAYLIGEKFLNFLEAAETHADFRAEIPAFVAEIKTIFERWQLAEYLERPDRENPSIPAFTTRTTIPRRSRWNGSVTSAKPPTISCWWSGRRGTCSRMARRSRAHGGWFCRGLGSRAGADEAILKKHKTTKKAVTSADTWFVYILRCARRLSVHGHRQGRDPSMRTAQCRDRLALHPQSPPGHGGVSGDPSHPEPGVETRSGDQGHVTTGEGIADKPNPRHHAAGGSVTRHDQIVEPITWPCP